MGAKSTDFGSFPCECAFSRLQIHQNCIKNFDEMITYFEQYNFRRNLTQDVITEITQSHEHEKNQIPHRFSLKKNTVFVLLNHF